MSRRTLSIGSGRAQKVAVVDLTTQGAAINSTLLYAVPAGSAQVFRCNWVATVTRAATTSSTLGGSALGLQLVYTDADDSVAKTTPGAAASAAGSNLAFAQINQANTTAAQTSGSIVIRAKAGTNINYQFGYTSSGATTMQYNLHIVLEAL